MRPATLRFPSGVPKLRPFPHSLTRRDALRLLAAGGCALPGCARPLASARGVVTIRSSFWGMAQERRVWEDLAAAFHRKQQRVRVQLEHIAGQNYHAKVLAMTIGRCAPDVLAADDEQFRQLAGNGLYTDLRPFLEADGLHFKREIYPELWETFAIGERQYALPYLGTCLLVYYNRDQRRQAGLKPDPDPDWTWDAFDADAIALTRDLDGDGRKDQFGFNRQGWFYCLQFVWAAGGTDMDPAMSHYLFDTPEAKRGFQFHYDHMHTHKVCPLTSDLPNMNTESMFFTGKVSMILNGAWWLVQARQAKSFDWDVAPMPVGPKRRATRVTGEGLAISPQTPHKAEAWEWLKFVASEEGQRIIAGHGRGIPAVRAVARDTFRMPDTPQHEEYFLDAMDNYARRSSLHPNFMATEAVFTREWDRLILGQFGVDEWVRRTLPEANAIVRGEGA